MESEPTPPPERVIVKPGRGPLIVAVGATVVGLILLLSFAYLLLRGDDVADGDSGNDPTPFPQVVDPPAVQEVVVVGISNSETISVALDSPVALTAGGATYTLFSERVTGTGLWAPDLAEDGRGVWVHGSVINYIIALRDSVANREVMQSLIPGDELVLRTAGNTKHRFAFSSRELVSTSNRDIYAQNQPGVTIILAGTTGNERLVIRGRYIIDEDSTGSGAVSGGEIVTGGVVELGETAQLGDLLVTVVGARYLYDRPEAPPGFAFFLVDYELENVGLSPFDTEQMRLTLSDQVGNQYALNPIASQLGNNPRLTGALTPGVPVQATAGYQVPSGLADVAVRWQVIRTDDGTQVLVNIPFTNGGDGPLSGPGAAAVLQQAEVSPDGTSLLLLGQLTNLGDQALVVTEEDVSLTSEGTVYLILSVNPGFPWVVSSGQTIPFSVTFQRPFASSAVFQVVNQPFQLNGLR